MVSPTIIILLQSYSDFFINLFVPENEKLNFDAVTKIHSHLDDDRNGKVDLTESNEVSVR